MISRRSLLQTGAALAALVPFVKNTSASTVTITATGRIMYDQELDVNRWWNADEIEAHTAAEMTFRDVQIAKRRHEAARTAYLKRFKPGVLEAEEKRRYAWMDVRRMAPGDLGLI